MNALITGGSRGIGKAIAAELSKKDSKIILNATNDDNLQKAQNELAGFSSNVELLTFKADLADKGAVKELVSFATEHMDKLDILVNNAGCFIPGKIIEEPEGILEKMMDTNLFSAYNLTRGVLPLLRRSVKAHIFNMCSVASILPYENGGSYSISKYALLGFSKCLREELKQEGIRVTALIPGATYTDSWSSSGISEDRFMKPEDIAEILCSTYELSAKTNVEEIVLRPISGDI